MAVLATILFSVNAAAQEVGDNTLIVKSGFTPEIKNTGKLNDKPTMPDTTYSAPSFNYSIVSSRIQVPFRPRSINAARLEGEKLDKIYRGYVAAGFGNYATPMGELLYSMGRSRDQKAGLQLRHLSSAGELDDYLFPGYSENLARSYYSKMWRRNRFDAEVFYKRNMFHYYGVDKTDTLLTKGEDLSDEANEHLFHRAGLNLSFGRYRVLREKMNFDLDLDYYYLLDNYSSRENGLKFNGFVDWQIHGFDALDNQKVGVQTDFNFFNNSDSLHIHNAWLLNVRPYYTFDYKRIQLKLGMTANIAEDTVSEIKIFPDIAIKLEIVPDNLNLQFTMSGGVKRNTYDVLSAENPFVNSILDLHNSINTFRTTIGMYSSMSRYIDFQLGMDYQKWQSGALYVPDTTIQMRNKFAIMYENYDLIRFNAALAFHATEKIDVVVDACYNVYNTNNELYAWSMPDYRLKMQGIYRMGDKFRFHSDLIYTGPSYVPAYTSGIATSVEVKPWLDFSLGAEYRYKKRFGFFVNFNNVIASKYQRWYSYPSYGFNLMGGLSYIF